RGHPGRGRRSHRRWRPQCLLYRYDWMARGCGFHRRAAPQPPGEWQGQAAAGRRAAQADALNMRRALAFQRRWRGPALCLALLMVCVSSSKQSAPGVAGQGGEGGRGSGGVNDVDVYLIGGQSNATGQGYSKNTPSTFLIDDTVQLYHSSGLVSVGPANSWI